LQIVGDALATEDFGFIFTPDSDLVEPFNAALETIKADGYTEHLNVKWFFLYSSN
jgi:polar amino acid transport system substrate-binding protein